MSPAHTFVLVILVSGCGAQGPGDGLDLGEVVPGEGDAMLLARDGGHDATVAEAGDGSVLLADAAGFSYVPTPSGCIVDVSAGDHTFSCDGLTVDVTIPVLATQCPATGCGLVLELHGDTGTGPLIDANLRLRERGPARGYLVLAPTGPAIGMIGGTTYFGSTWGPSADASLVALTNRFVSTFKIDPKRVHVTGFSRGGFTTWRLGCDHADLFASIAPGGAGNGSKLLLSATSIEPTCFQDGRTPSRPLDVLFLLGRTDANVPYAQSVSIRNNALAAYGLAITDAVTVKSSASFTQQRTIKSGAPTIEWFDHAYEVDPAGTYASNKGHCIPGSTFSATAPHYAVACKPPTAFDWGAEILDFFDHHPLP